MAAPDDGAPLTAAIDTLLRGRVGAAPVGVAVSGGGDSTALLLTAIDWAGKAGISLQAATVDHGLRAEAAGEARQVADLCARHAIPHETLTLTGLRDGADLQARARDARYAALAGWARSRGIETVLLGHTADDVAETLLMRLARGTGLDGLAAMAEWRRVGDIDFGRPFLRRTRAGLRAELARRGVVPVEDPSNDEPRFERVRVRQAMAALDLDPERLARSARHLADARAALNRHTADLAGHIVHEDRGDLLLTRRDMQRLPPEILRRLLLAALRWIGGAPAPREAEQTRLMKSAADLTRPITLAGCLVSPLPGPLPGLRLAREAAACAPPVPLIGGRAEWDGRWRITGPALPGLTVGALARDISLSRWRETGLPRASLMASPALRDADGTLLSAPLAGLSGDHVAELSTQFAATLRSRGGVFD